MTAAAPLSSVACLRPRALIIFVMMFNLPQPGSAPRKLRGAFHGGKISHGNNRLATIGATCLLEGLLVPRNRRPDLKKR
jgi:hypothetical protein